MPVTIRQGTVVDTGTGSVAPPPAEERTRTDSTGFPPTHEADRVDYDPTKTDLTHEGEPTGAADAAEHVRTSVQWPEGVEVEDAAPEPAKTPTHKKAAKKKG